jgi:hypothetical protein
MEVSVNFLGVQMSVDDLHLHGIYKLYIWLLTFTCTILVFTSKYDEFGGFFQKEIFWGPSCFDPKKNFTPKEITDPNHKF